jgi:hypothetical protein
MMVKPRIKTPRSDDYSEDILKQYEILDVSTMTLATNPKVLKLNSLVNDPNIKAAIVAKRFSIAHSDKPSATINIPFESGTEAVPIKIENNIIDMPLVSEELVWLLSKMLAEEEIKDSKILFKSGARANDTKGK